VPGTINCSLDIIASQIDINTIIKHFVDDEASRPTDGKKRVEHSTFTVLRELTQNIPKAIYNCYFIPQVSAFMWRQHLAKFEDLEDFEAGFTQNLLGQILSLQDALHQINEAIRDQDTEKIIFQVGRVTRRIFNFGPMKSASLHPRLATVSSPFPESTVSSMRDLHDHLLNGETDSDPTTHQRPRLKSTPFVSTVDSIEVPFYASLGFIEGAFAPPLTNTTEDKSSENNSTESAFRRNVTECRTNTIRFINNMTYLAWYAELDYGVDRIMLYSTQMATQSFPFLFHCYFTFDEAVGVATSEGFMDSSIQELLEDAVYEMREHTDAARRIFKLATDILESRQAEGTGFQNKDWYVIGLNAGIIFNNISSKRQVFGLGTHAQ